MGELDETVKRTECGRSSASLAPDLEGPADQPRVLHVITHFDLGGAEEVAMALTDTLRDQFDFAVFAVLSEGAGGPVGRDMARRLADWGVPSYFGARGRFKSGGVILAALSLLRAIRRFRPDAIHVHTEIPELTLATACAMSARARRVPLLRTVHNSELWIAWQGLGRWVTGRLAHGQAVAVSRRAAEADAAIATRSVRPRADVIHNGVRRPTPGRPERRAGSVRVLFAGRMVLQKGADLLPDVLERAWSLTERRDVAVTLAGAGELIEGVKTALSGRLAGWDVCVVPPLERLAERLHDYDAVLMPSRFEGFGLLALETLGAGVPLVVTIAPGLDEVLPPDYPFQAEPGDVAALGERLARIIDDPIEARVAAASFTAWPQERFSSDAMARAYASRYRALCARRGLG